MAKKGRPRREPTAEEKKKVEDLVALKATVGDIAKALGRSEPNLRKYFRPELFSEKKSGPAKKNPKATKPLRKRVVRYIGIGMSPQEVADAIDCDLDFFEANFSDEIRTGRAKARAMVADNLFGQMEKEISGATNRLESLTAVAIDAGPKAHGEGPTYVGKKVAERAGARAAVSAGGKFAPMAPPKLVVDNSGGK